MSRKPTPKQKLAAEKILENAGKPNPKPVGEVLKEVGYSDAIAKNPQDVTNSQGFLAVLDKAGVTEDRISQVMHEGLNATKTTAMGTDPDYAVRHKYMESALKARGLVNTGDGNTINQYNLAVKEMNINPNAPKAKEVAQEVLDVMMAKYAMPLDEESE